MRLRRLLGAAWAGVARLCGHPVVTCVITAMAGLFVYLALIVPSEVRQFTPAAFVRVPVEAILGAAVVLVVAARARRVVALLAGTVLGLLTILKIIDVGFQVTLARPFHPVLDWSLFGDAASFVTDTAGPVGAVGAVAAAVLLAAAVLAVMTLAVRRLTGLAVRHRAVTARTATALTVVWVACAVADAQLVYPVPVASRSAASLAYKEAQQVSTSLRDRETFAREVAADRFRDTPNDQLLTALRGKDVVFTFIESYGRDAVQNPEFASQVGAVLDDGNRRLGAAGFGARSGFLTAPTAGAGSVLSHATFLSGLWVGDSQRHRSLTSSDRMTLPSAFRRASWQTAAVMPGNTKAWPEGKFYGYDREYGAYDLGYHGPSFSWATMPDQFTLSAFDRIMHAAPHHPPTMSEIVLVSSHSPWAPIPRMVDPAAVGDGSIYNAMAKEGDPWEVIWKDDARVRTEYRRSIEYSLNSLISYVEQHGDDNLVLVFLGDHQPAPVVTGDGASRDVPITIVARDRSVLDRISGWGWDNGLKPGPNAPVWRMDAFRDRFLTAFGPTGEQHPPPGS
ncbi:sulfatase-like hydrolase/transferase [Pseudonocardia acaciae]|uniref:sulfatase-like hydrolase/transferase n=1 Tax=Pseudonocardia acaciae TaxID=551276 RepID=UPI000A01D9C1|nr:sulfatase-like hydrolase/transferase [Pseudonocardia acaciae]